MGDRSTIEWTDASWTPIRSRKDGKLGWHCEHVSEGCRNCYAEAMNRWRGTGLDFKPAHRGHVHLFLDEKMLDAPLRWRKPRMVFVCSMTDLFADFVPDGWIMRVFMRMWQCPQHTFQVLTKRPERMRDFMQRWGDLSGEDGEFKNARGPEAVRKAHPSGRGQLFAAMLEAMGDPPPGAAYPLFDWLHGMIRWPMWPSNVWLGTSCEDQATADARIPHLLATPAAVRFVSAEPLLGPIRLRKLKLKPGLWLDARTGAHEGTAVNCPLPPMLPALDWVIAGGESGPHARPMHPDWPRALRDQCAEAWVPFFFKQWGEWMPRDDVASERAEDLELRNRYEHLAGQDLVRVGKKRAGRLLDGREHNGMPGSP